MRAAIFVGKKLSLEPILTRTTLDICPECGSDIG